MDVVFLGAMALFYVVSVALVAGCARLGDQP